MEDENWIDTATSMFEPAPQSVAETLLAKVFGNWVLDEDSSRGLEEGPLIYGNFVGLDEVTLLSTLLGYSGILAAAFGLIITSYTFLMQMVKNSWNGTFSADGINSIFWPARTVAALALILPIVTIGSGERTTSIATSQLLMMDIAKAGSGFADSVTASYVTNAFAFPINNARPPEQADAVFEMLEIASCALFGAAFEGDAQAPHAQVINAETYNGNVTSYLPGKFIEQDDFNAYRAFVTENGNDKKTLVSAGTVSAAIDSAFNTSNLRRITFGNNGQCGEIRFEGEREIQETANNGSAGLFGESSSNSGGAVTNDSMRSVMTFAQTRIANAYRPALKTLTKSVFVFVDQTIDSERYTAITEDLDAIDAATSTEAKVFYRMIINFNQDLYTRVSDQLALISERLGGTMFQPVIDGGWAALGSMYSVIPRISSIAISNTSTAHSRVSASNQEFKCATSQADILDKVVTWVTGCEARENMLAYSEGVINLTKQYRASYADSNRPQIGVLDYCTADECNVRAAQSSAAMGLSRSLLNVAQGVGGTLTTGDTDQTGANNTAVDNQDANSSLGDRDWRNTRDPNPISTLSSLGASMTTTGVVFQLSAFKLSGVVEAGNNAANGISPGKIKAAAGFLWGFIANAIASLGEFLNTLSYLLIASGFYLTYILPMIPFIIFVMQVVGWLATTIEGMFASTFAIALLTNSDGDGAINTGFLKAISLTAAIFLKPFFIVIGVAVSHAIAAPAFGFFNDQFWQAWEIDNALSGEGSNIVFEVSAQLMLYLIASTLLVKFIYSVQHIIPDSMNNWVAGGIVNPFGVGDSGDKVEGAVTGGTQSVSKSAVDGMKNVRQAQQTPTKK